MIRSKQDLHRW